MKTIKVRNQSLVLASLLASAAGLSACGNDQPANAVGQPVAPLNPAAQQQPISQQSFEDRCRLQMGQIRTVNAQTVCETQQTWPNSTLGAYGGVGGISISGTWFPLLTPSQPAGFYAHSTGITVKPQDRVTVTASGNWGAPVTNQFDLFGFIPVYTTYTDCSQITVAGIKRDDSSVQTHEGMPKGLVISDSSKVYFVGNSNTVTIENQGTLKFGINTPAVNGGCATIQLSQIRVQHCELASGQSVSCQ